MAPFNPELFLSTLALIGAVIMLSALLSGFIDRSGLPQVAFFLAMGGIIGPWGLNLVDATVESPILRVVATLSLALVLFTDAVSLDVKELRSRKLLAFLVLGPGTILSAALVALAAWWLLGMSPPMAAMVGAALASTDPVLLRGLLRRPGVDANVRQALRLESGLNDAVLLPVVLIAMAFLPQTSSHGSESLGRLVVNMFLLGPGAGVAVGLLGVAALEFVRRRTGVRRDYESLYSLGVAFAAFAAAEAVHGSGFLAAFAAGLTVSAVDVELCDCFLEYGETTAEMALLFTFVLFGTSMIWSGLGTISVPVLLFTGFVFLARPVAFLGSLAFTPLSWRKRLTIAWFGPKGLSSLLLILLPVFAGIPGSEQLLSVCCLVVLVSVVVHGLSPLAIRRDQAEPAVSGEAADQIASPGASALESSQEASPVSKPDVITIEEMPSLRTRGVPMIVLDARTERTFEESDLLAEGTVRLSPDNAVVNAERLKLPREAILAVFCA